MSAAIDNAAFLSNANEIRSAYGVSRDNSSIRRQPSVDPVNTENNPTLQKSAEQQQQQDDTEQSEKRSDLRQTVAETNHNLELAQRAIRFRINEDTEDVQIQVIDTKHDRVIRTIPSDEMLRLSARMRELSGIGAMVDRFR